MFQLHDRTRRRLCIAAFLLLGALPTLLVGGWCLARHLPGAVQTEADSLGRQLGLAVKLDGLKHLRPGMMLYEGLQLSDPETGQTLLRCRCLEVAWQVKTDEQGRRRPTLSVVASQPELEAASIDRSWQWVQRMLESRPNRADVDLQFSAAEITLRAGDRSQTLTEVVGRMETVPGGTHATADFRLAGAAAPEPARLRVVRDRQTTPPASGFEISTGDGELPCSVLAMGLAELKPLGERCRFRGRIWAKETTDGWEGEVAGQLVELDLGSLVTDHFPHRLTGLGEATIQTARFRRGRLESGSGFLSAGPGTIDRTLAAAAVERLGLVPADDLFAPAPLDDPDQSVRIRYRQLALFLSLDSRGLLLRGRCDGAEPGTIAAAGNRRLLGEPAQAPQPVAALVRTLVPQTELQVPASRQTDWLLRHLPLPEASLLPVGGSAIPTARLRLPDEWRR